MPTIYSIAIQAFDLNECGVDRDDAIVGAMLNAWGYVDGGQFERVSMLAFGYGGACPFANCASCKA